MQVPHADQRHLVDVAVLDAQLAALTYRDNHLPEQDTLEQLRTAERNARDGAARAQIRLEDTTRAHRKAVGELESLTTRAARTQERLSDPATGAAEKRELGFDIAAVERLRAEAETAVHDLTVQREAAKADLDHEGARVDALAEQIAAAEQARSTALGDLEAALAATRRDLEAARTQAPAELLSVYDEVRAERGAGAGELLGRRCGACQMELDNTTLAEFAEQPLDAVLRCPECRAILVRPVGTQE